MVILNLIDDWLSAAVFIGFVRFLEYYTSSLELKDYFLLHYIS